MEGKISLNGEWNFTFEDGSRSKLPVPGCFDLAPEYYLKRGKGSYSCMVDCSGMMELECGGLGLRAEIFWDGIKIAAELSAYTPLKVHFDAGPAGEHELKIVCDNLIEETPESEFRRFYDFYGFGGIYREITLRQLPETYLDCVRVLPDFDNGTIALLAELTGEVLPIRVIIDGKMCGILQGGKEQIFKVENPRAWSPDDPYLHHLQLDCGSDSYECRFGIRKIESRKNRIYLNGELLKIVGVNRHDVFPDTGPAVTEEQLYRDMQMIKQAGFNMIRGAHYPQSQMMLNFADELGLLVWDEILGWGNPVDSLTDPEFQRRQCDALTRMIKSSVNHPCVVMWGFLNEAATSETVSRECIGKLAKLARELDPSRLVTFASMFGEKDLCLDLVDVISFNTYPGWYSGTNTFFETSIVTNKLEELHSFVRNTSALADKPVLISEIGAASLIGVHGNRRWSEEYHAQLVECAVNWVLDNDDSSGILLWQFCNSPVDDNNRIMMRPRGYNNKGLVDEYRKPKSAWKLFPGILEKRFLQNS